MSNTPQDYKKELLTASQAKLRKSIDIDRKMNWHRRRELMLDRICYLVEKYLEPIFIFILILIALLAIAFLVAIGIEFCKLDSSTKWSYITHTISAFVGFLGGIFTILTRRNNKNDK